MHFDKHTVKSGERRKNCKKKLALKRGERKRLIFMVAIPSLQKQIILEHRHEGMPENRETSK